MGVDAGQGHELSIKYVGGEPLKDLVLYANLENAPLFEVAPQPLWSWLDSAASILMKMMESLV